MGTDVPWLERLKSALGPIEVDVTATVPSGRALYVVEGARPDLLLVAVTPSNSSEMASFVRAARMYVGSATIAFGDPDEGVMTSMLDAGAAYVVSPRS